MATIMEQRKYIQDFIDFTGSFLLTEQATTDELNLAQANLDILRKRIAGFGKTKTGGMRAMEATSECPAP